MGYYQTLYIFTLKSLTINTRNVLRLTCTDQRLQLHLRYILYLCHDEWHYHIFSV